MKYYCISDHCRWVNGATGSAFYDFLEKKVQSINEINTNTIKKALLNKKLSQEEIHYLDSLVKDGYLNNHTNPIPDYIVKPSIRYVWLELTNKCNCRCLHCYGAFGVSSEIGSSTELTTDEWISIIDKLSDMGCDAIQFIGGEPLIFNDFQRILEYAHKKIRRIDIFTNASLMTDKLADSISKVGASVRVSLYGYNAETHDMITQNHGSFYKLDNSLTLLQERKIPVTISVVIMRENQEWLPNIREYIEKKGFQYTGYDTVRPVSHSPQTSHSVTNTEIVKNRTIHNPPKQTSIKTYSINSQWNSCWYGKFAITADGSVLPCIFARDLSCGNIRTEDHELIREKLLSYWRITKDNVETCKECEYRYACDDCRPLAMGEGKGLTGKYPRCLYNPSLCYWDEL